MPVLDGRAWPRRSSLTVPGIEQRYAAALEVGKIAGCDGDRTRASDRRDHGIERVDRTANFLSGRDDFAVQIGRGRVEGQDPIAEAARKKGPEPALQIVPPPASGKTDRP